MNDAIYEMTVSLPVIVSFKDQIGNRVQVKIKQSDDTECVFNVFRGEELYTGIKDSYITFVVAKPSKEGKLVEFLRKLFKVPIEHEPIGFEKVGGL